MTSQDRAARAARARRDGRAKTATKAPTPAPVKPAPVKKSAPVAVVPDTVARQARAAAARINETEARRRDTPPAPVSQRGQDVHDRDVHKAIENMNLDFVQCRDFGHSWRPFSARWNSVENAYESQLQCSRCFTTRTRWLSTTGQQLQSSYDYAEGYTVKGLGRLTGSDRDIVRLTSVLALVQNGEAK